MNGSLEAFDAFGVRAADAAFCRRQPRMHLELMALDLLGLFAKLEDALAKLGGEVLAAPAIPITPAKS